jgi:hypothetical protein
MYTSKNKNINIFLSWIVSSFEYLLYVKPPKKDSFRINYSQKYGILIYLIWSTF